MTDSSVAIDGAVEALRAKVRQLYSFLKEANQVHFRPIRTVSEQQYVIRIADMPKHPSAQLFRPIKIETAIQTPDALIKVSRPKLSKCPTPPDSCLDWLVPGWDDPYLTPEVVESKNKVEVEINENGELTEVTRTIFFVDEDLRVTDLEQWLTSRKKWVEPEIVARGAMRYFERFYSLYSKIEKEGEKLELLIADGILSWKTESGIDGEVSIQHPIIFKRVELRFNPNIPEFTVHDTEREVELYNNLFLDLKAVNSSSIRNRKEELESSGYHPLGWEDTSAYLKTFALTVSPTEGEYLDEPGEGIQSHPRIWRDPLLLLRTRTAGIATAVDKIIGHIDEQAYFPPALAQITGEKESAWSETGFSNTQPKSTGFFGDKRETVTAVSTDDILLVSEANDEQIQIVKRLNRSGSVVVQGPPGTGKTHTISNLIGHLLSQGKSILVTAHTAKALRVLRDKVPDMLKPLCVSVLGSDQLARRQLESAISAITERLTSETHQTLSRKGETYREERNALIQRQLNLKHLLREAIENEYKAIELGTEKYSPTDAARTVAHTKKGNDWIPSPVKLGFQIESQIPNLERLYSLNGLFSNCEEEDTRLHVPKISDLPTETEFEALVSDRQALLTQDLSLGRDKWHESEFTSNDLEPILLSIRTEFDDVLLAQSWRPFAIVSGIHGATEAQVWLTLIDKIEAAAESNAKYVLTLEHRAKLSEALPVHKQLELLNQICVHLENGGNLGFLQLVTKSEWRHLIKGLNVAAGTPTHIDHFKALRQLADLKVKRLDFEELWNALIGHRTSQLFENLGPEPEQICRALIPEIKRCLRWNATVWDPLAVQLKRFGLKLDELISALPRETTQVAEYTLIEKFATSTLVNLVEKEFSRKRLREIDNEFMAIRDLLTSVNQINPNKGCVGRFLDAAINSDVTAYRGAMAYLRRIHLIKPLVQERDRLLLTLSDHAPVWSKNLAHRLPPHDQSIPPGDIRKAWVWRQLNDTLDERSKLDAQRIQDDLYATTKMLQEVTRLLVDAKAWAEQLKRLESESSMRQALVGWLDTAKRLASTRHIDKRQTLLIEARKLMTKCSEAVPVWIMPISIMAESFDPQVTKFDVVIIDEASQADINALIPLYMGKQIIVVGDHEQVTPLGVGKDQTMLENLRKAMLKDIPNSHLYDNMSSIYDLARQSFGEGVRLVEHFRCVPQIISFSNALSYEGKIRPLREANSSELKPACVPYRVRGIRDGDTNREEAKQIVAFIKAMTKHKAYQGKTIGVISMLGDGQPVLIQSMIHKEIESVEIENRRIQSGIAAEFQGDERDVIFLSMVDSPADTNTLRTTGEGAFEQIKKRYNVAVSRARDQLWVVHSFDPELHLKAADIRYRLLQHVRDPDSSTRNFEQEVGRTESPFEKEVLRYLTNAGFKVKTQVEVGYFRIDLVVEGNGKRLAVECDGDRYHPVEKLAEDMNRQAILERLGWSFTRIRGSAFYRDPEQAMKSVFRRLEELDIIPNTTDSTSELTNQRELIDDLTSIIASGFVDKVEEDTSDKVEVSNTAFLEEMSQASNDIQKLSNIPPRVEDVQELVVEEISPKFQPSNPPPVLTSVTPISLAEYTAYCGLPCRDPRVTSRLGIAEDLFGIVKVEGPIQIKRAFDIFLRSCGIKRMGHEIRDNMLSAINVLKKAQKIEGHTYREGDDELNEFVWLFGTPPEVQRKRGDRTLEEIPLGELYALSSALVLNYKLELGSEEHLRALLEALHLKRLTSNAEAILRTAISGRFKKAPDFRTSNC